MSETKSKRNYRGWLIRVLGSAVFLFVLSRFLPLAEVAAAVSRIDLQTFVGVLLVFLLIHVAAALKWRWLLGMSLSPRAAVQAHYAGLAANLCLPGAVGGDVVRAGLAQAEMNDIGTVAAAGAIDRAIDIIALLAVTAIGLGIIGGGEDISTLVLRITIVLLFGIGGLILLWRLLPIIWKLAPRLPGRNFAERFVISCGQVAANPFKLMAVLAVAVLIQLALVCLSWWLAVATSAEVELGHWMFAWPLAKIIAVLPLSLNGLGLREASLAALLVQFGADPVAIVAAGLVWQAILFLAGGIGGLVFLMARRKL